MDPKNTTSSVTWSLKNHPHTHHQKQGCLIAGFKEHWWLAWPLNVPPLFLVGAHPASGRPAAGGWYLEGWTDFFFLASQVTNKITAGEQQPKPPWKDFIRGLQKRYMSIMKWTLGFEHCSGVILDTCFVSCFLNESPSKRRRIYEFSATNITPKWWTVVL